jgi:hypothetical protein
MVTGLQYGYCYRWKLQICKLYKYTMEENTNHTIWYFLTCMVLAATFMLM